VAAFLSTISKAGVDMFKVIAFSVLIMVLSVFQPVFSQTAGEKAADSDDGTVRPSLDPRAEMDLFYEAMKFAREGDSEHARTLLEKIIENQPPGAFQDDAYYEMARISDEEDHNYSDAIKRYQLMAERFPNARPARRALRRAEFLKKAISSGEERFARYEAVLKNPDKKSDPLKQIEEIKNILEGDTPFALEWDAQMWMAVKYRSLNNCDEAIEVYEQMESGNADESKKREAMLGRADCLLSVGNVYTARTLYEKLVETEGFGADTARNRLLEIGHSATRKYLRYASITTIAIMFTLLIVLLPGRIHGRSYTFRPPFELLMVLPVFLAAFVAAVQKGQFAWQAIGMSALPSLLAIYATPLLVKGFNPQSAVSKTILFTAFAITIMAAMFLVIDFGNLYDQIIYDIENGL